MDLAALGVVLFWIALVALVAIDEARRERRTRRHDDVDALIERDRVRPGVRDA